MPELAAALAAKKEEEAAASAGKPATQTQASNQGQKRSRRQKKRKQKRKQKRSAEPRPAPRPSTPPRSASKPAPGKSKTVLLPPPEEVAGGPKPEESGELTPQDSVSDWFVETTEQLEAQHARLSVYHFQEEKERNLFPYVLGVLLLLFGVGFAVFGGDDDPPVEVASTEPDAASKPAAKQPKPKPVAVVATPTKPTPAAPKVEKPVSEALEAQARKALAERRWTGAADALAPTLVRLRAADSGNAAATEVGDAAVEMLLRKSASSDDLGAAKVALETALTVVPGDPKATKLLADLRARTAREAEAREAAQRAAEEAARREAADAAREAEAVAKRAAREAEAKARAEEAKRGAERVAASPKKKKKKKKMTAAERREARQLVSKGRTFAKARNFGAAKSAFKDAIKVYPKNAPAYAGLSDIAFQQKKFGEAAKYSARSVRYSPRNANYRVDLAKAYFRQNKHAKAKKELEKALDIKPGHATAEKYLKVVKRKLGQ